MKVVPAALCLILTSGLATYAQRVQNGAPRSAAATKKVRKLQGDLQRVQSRKASARKSLSRTKRQVRTVRGDLREIDARLTGLETDLARTTFRLNVSREEQGRLAEELKVATHRLQEKREQLRSRLRAMYVRGEPTLVSIVIGSESVSDVASRAFLMERIAKADRNLFEEYGALRDQVAAQKRRQDELVAEIGQLKRSQEAQQAGLEDTKQQKSDFLETLKDRQQDLERIFAELD